MLFSYYTLGLTPEAVKALVANLKAEGKSTEEIIVEVVSQNNQDINANLRSTLQSFEDEIRKLR